MGSIFGPKSKSFSKAMAEKRIPTPPRVGFSILANGMIQRGEAGSYREEDVAAWYKRWQVMKSLGYFSDALPGDQLAAPSTTASSSTEQSEVAVDFYVGLKESDTSISTATKKMKDGDVEQQMPEVPASSKKKNKKDKKKKRK
jgi:hypothetical protein